VLKGRIIVDITLLWKIRRFSSKAEEQWGRALQGKTKNQRQESSQKTLLYSLSLAIGARKKEGLSYCFAIVENQKIPVVDKFQKISGNKRCGKKLVSTYLQKGEGEVTSTVAKEWKNITHEATLLQMEIRLMIHILRGKLSEALGFFGDGYKGIGKRIGARKKRQKLTVFLLERDSLHFVIK
jgi:hypothetical protein